MDCMYPNLMAREDLIRILRERQLKIPNIDDLPLEELTKIFSKFAVPLGRRADKAFNSIDCIPLTNIDKSKMYNGKTNGLKRNLSSAEKKCNKMDKLEKNDTVSETESCNKKRVNSDNSEIIQNKRKKICWP